MSVCGINFDQPLRPSTQKPEQEARNDDKTYNSANSAANNDSHIGTPAVADMPNTIDAHKCLVQLDTVVDELHPYLPELEVELGDEVELGGEVELVDEVELGGEVGEPLPLLPLRDDVLDR